MRRYFVYILASRSGVLYVGMTNDLERRVWQHKTKRVAGFTSRYNVNLLMRYEEFGTAWDAIEREKEIKGWRREKKVGLIESENPTWQDLVGDWFEAPPVTAPAPIRHPEAQRGNSGEGRRPEPRDPSVAEAPSG